MNEETVYCIVITYRDDENNTFVELGGAGWTTQREWDNAWDNIPAVDINDPTHCIADKINENDDIIDDRPVSRETVEILLGKPISQLIGEGRANR